MEYFTLRNTAILALGQVGVIVAGVLAAGAAHKWYATAGLTTPAFTALFSEYGFLALVLPVAWTALALQALWRAEVTATTNWLPVCSGVALTVLLLYGTWYAAVRPLVRLLGCGCTLGA